MPRRVSAKHAAVPVHTKTSHRKRAKHSAPHAKHAKHSASHRKHSNHSAPHAKHVKHAKHSAFHRKHAQTQQPASGQAFALTPRARGGPLFVAAGAALLLVALLVVLYFTCNLPVKPASCSTGSATAASSTASATASAGSATTGLDLGGIVAVIVAPTLTLFVGYLVYRRFGGSPVPDKETDNLRLTIENTVAQKRRAAKGEATLLGVFKAAAEQIATSSIPESEKQDQLRKLVGALNGLNNYDAESVKTALTAAGVQDVETVFAGFKAVADAEDFIAKNELKYVKALTGDPGNAANITRSFLEKSNLLGAALTEATNQMNSLRAMYEPQTIDVTIEGIAEKNTAKLASTGLVIPSFGDKKGNKLVNEISGGKAFKVIVGGPPSAGKSILASLWVKTQQQRGKDPLVIDVSRAALSLLDERAGQVAARHEIALEAVIRFAKQQSKLGRPVLLFHDEAQNDINENVFRGNYVKATTKLGDVSWLGTTNERNLLTKKDPDGSRSALSNRLRFVWVTKRYFDRRTAESFVNRKLEEMKMEFKDGDIEEFKETVKKVMVMLNNSTPRQTEQALELAIRDAESQGRNTIGGLSAFLPDNRKLTQKTLESVVNRDF